MAYLLPVGYGLVTYPKVALHVAPDNQPGLDLYAHLHYRMTQKRLLYQRPFLHMAKTLE